MSPTPLRIYPRKRRSSYRFCPSRLPALLPFRTILYILSVPVNTAFRCFFRLAQHHANAEIVKEVLRVRGEGC